MKQLILLLSSSAMPTDNKVV